LKKILITGGSGFIGSEIVRQGILRGYKIVNVDALKYSGNENNNVTVSHNSNYVHIKLDILNFSELETLIQKTQPNYIIHAAAESHVDRSIDSPRVFCETNIMGTYNILEATKNYIVKKTEPFRYIHISTDEVYGSLEMKGKPFDLDSVYAPNSPYSASKASSDHLVRAWQMTYGFPSTVINCSNNYGQYQFPEKLIPKTIINALRGHKIPIYGSGENVRDWLFVSDHVDALYKIVETDILKSKYLLGGDAERTNLEIVNNICEILDELRRPKIPFKNLIEFVEDRKGHDKRYAVDASETKKALNWRPQVTFDEGIRKTVIWYLENEHWWDKF